MRQFQPSIHTWMSVISISIWNAPRTFVHVHSTIHVLSQSQNTVSKTALSLIFHGMHKYTLNTPEPFANLVDSKDVQWQCHPRSLCQLVNCDDNYFSVWQARWALSWPAALATALIGRDWQSRCEKDQWHSPLPEQHVDRRPHRDSCLRSRDLATNDHASPLNRSGQCWYVQAFSHQRFVEL